MIDPIDLKIDLVIVRILFYKFNKKIMKVFGPKRTFTLAFRIFIVTEATKAYVYKLIYNKFFKIFNGKRFAKVIALIKFAPHFKQILFLLL